MTEETKGKVNPRLVLLLGVVGVSTSSLLVRASEAPALALAAMRLLWTVLMLTPVVVLRFRAELRRVTVQDLGMCSASGVLLALHFVTWFESLKRTTVASSTVLVSTEALFCALGFALFLKGRIPKLGVFAILLAFAGSAAVAFGAGSGGGGSLSGNLLALVAAVFVAGYTLIGRVQRGHLSTTVYTFLTYSACAAVLCILCLVTRTPLTGYPLREYGIGLLLAVLCTLMGHSVFSWCLKYLSPAFVAAAKLCEPVFASVLAAILFREVPLPLQIAGYVAILGGIALYILAERDTPTGATGRKAAQ